MIPPAGVQYHEPGTYFYRDKGRLTGWNVSPLIEEINGDVRIYPYVWWSA